MGPNAYGSAGGGQPPYGSQNPYGSPGGGAGSSGAPNPYGGPADPYAPPNPYGSPYGDWRTQSPWGPTPAPGGWPGGPTGPGGPSGPGGWGWNPGGTPGPRRTLPGAITALLLVVAVLVGLGLGHGVWRASSTNNNNGLFPGNGFSTLPGGGNGTGNGNGSGNSGNTSSIASRVAPELVDINTNLFQNSGEAAGTGIVLTPNGLILTNNHVISGASQIEATDIGNGHNYPATVVGYDRTHDIALIQLQGAHGLQTATIGDSSKVQVGDQIVGIGNAGGVGGTPSSAGGTVTGLNQSITATDESDQAQEQLSGLIEVDANIQPGDSGGSLVDSQGHVIGVDTAASQGFSIQTNSGQGFAIPINQAMSIVHQIQSGQTTSVVHIGPTAFLGVYVNVSTSGGQGASLKDVVQGGPAAKAGLGAGDVITSLGSTTINSSGDLTNSLVPYHPGDKVRIGWSDSTGVTHTATVSLGNGPAA